MLISIHLGGLNDIVLFITKEEFFNIVKTNTVDKIVSKCKEAAKRTIDDPTASQMNKCDFFVDTIAFDLDKNEYERNELLEQIKEFEEEDE